MVLVTGFEPFGGARSNPSQRVAEALDGAVVAGMRVRSVVLPCRFGAAPEALRRALRRHRPDVVVSLGLAGNRSAITPEWLARNRLDARIPDNAGYQPRRQRINPRGPQTRRTGLPARDIAAALRAAGFPARVSRSAGRFVCNEVFYRLMEACPRRSGVRAGFIHVPPLGARGMTLAQLVRAVRLAIEVGITGNA
jgi:pyroglutamyl-peptidase